MKLRNEFLSHRNGGEAFIIPADGAKFSGLVRGNRTFGDVADLLKTDTTEQDIITAMRAKYDAPAGVIERDIRKALDIFREIGALDEH